MTVPYHEAMAPVLSLQPVTSWTGGRLLALATRGNEIDSSFSGPQATAHGSSFSSEYVSNAAVPDKEFYSEGDVKESPEPILSDVSDLEPVNSYRSHSSNQQERNMFSQIRYTPGEVLLPPCLSYRAALNQSEFHPKVPSWKVM